MTRKIARKNQNKPRLKPRRMTLNPVTPLGIWGTGGIM
jgi:hypothetical protein